MTPSAVPLLKWEYARLESGPAGVSVIFTHHEPWSGLPAEAFFDTMRRLGDDGWELVTALPLAAGADIESAPAAAAGGPDAGAGAGSPGSRGGASSPGSSGPQRMRLRLDTDRWLVFKRPQPLEPGKGSQTDLVRDLLQRQLLKGRLPLP